MYFLVTYRGTQQDLGERGETGESPEESVWARWSCAQMSLLARGWVKHPEVTQPLVDPLCCQGSSISTKEGIAQQGFQQPGSWVSTPITLCLPWSLLRRMKKAAA